MTDKKTLLKYYYSFSDFLFYIALLAIPVITAIVAILDKSIAGAVIFFPDISGFDTGYAPIFLYPLPTLLQG